ncbi:MAG: GYD domain-containing protein [Candidatus Omnitrophica bacterium]|nr:GYD domain-containing protein [Candidatus Omnitrophota bacterium]MCM8801970.1 GYD domain-containing protein [Candidatus Omnitrophota bacterium]
MKKFIMLSILTEKGAKTIKQKPERIREVNKEVEKMGGKILVQYAILGPFDFLTIIEVDDEKVAAKISLEFAQRGTVKITTYPALDIDDFINKIK